MSETDKPLLGEFLDVSQLTCLNESEEHTLRAILAKDRAPEAYLESDVDEQLLLNITFNQSVRIRTLAIRATEPARAPRKLKLFINQPTLAFDNLESTDIAQEIELTEEQAVQGAKIPLRYVRFQAVNSLHVFVESNQGDEEQTRIGEIDLWGSPVLGIRDLSGLQPHE